MEEGTEATREETRGEMVEMPVEAETVEAGESAVAKTGTEDREMVEGMVAVVRAEVARDAWHDYSS